MGLGDFPTEKHWIACTEVIEQGSRI